MSTPLSAHLYTPLKASLHEDGGTRVGTFRIALHAASPIYAAHFPGRPITPAACLLQMADECARSILPCLAGSVLARVQNMKLPAPLSPTATPVVGLSVKAVPQTGHTAWRVGAEFSDGDNLFAKMTLHYELPSASL